MLIQSVRVEGIGRDKAQQAPHYRSPVPLRGPQCPSVVKAKTPLRLLNRGEQRRLKKNAEDLLRLSIIASVCPHLVIVLSTISKMLQYRLLIA